MFEPGQVENGDGLYSNRILFSSRANQLRNTTSSIVSGVQKCHAFKVVGNVVERS